MRGEQVEVEVMRRSQFQERLRPVLQTGDAEELRQVLVNWLQAGRWDRDLWHQFYLVGPGRREVRA